MTRLELQSKLEELLGSRNVYYQPPENLKINYPCIVYSKNTLKIKSADNKPAYIKKMQYSVIIISKKPDSDVIDKLLEIEGVSYDRHYISDNLHHDSLTLYC